jgi:hypothetical protein
MEKEPLLTEGDRQRLMLLIRAELRRQMRRIEHRKVPFVPEPGKMDAGKLTVERLIKLEAKLLQMWGPSKPARPLQPGEVALTLELNDGRKLSVACDYVSAAQRVIEARKWPQYKGYWATGPAEALIGPLLLAQTGVSDGRA